MKTAFDPYSERYPSRRYPLYARGGMVNASTPQAAAAGLEILRRGGNAVDAAVAAAAALTVTEPCSNGIGSDAFAIVWSEKEKKLFGLNASGPAPLSITAEKVRQAFPGTGNAMPERGWTPVTVPGAPGAWRELTRRFGRKTLRENLAPAVEYAREGFPVSPQLALFWRASFESFRKTLRGQAFAGWFRTFAPDGKTPGPGDLAAFPDHAATLEAIGETDAETFYRGEIARRIDRESRKAGGYLRYEDLEGFRPLWVEPIRLSYRGYEVCEIPPNGQGIAALMALNILKEFEFPEKESVLTVHRQIEAMKLAFSDAFGFVTDPGKLPEEVSRYLDPAYGALRAREIGESALTLPPLPLPKSGTVYLASADGEGNMVSYIQSNYMGFGSGIVVDGTGIALQNRGADFSLDPAHPNFLEPGKRTYHTIIPGFLMKDGLPVGPFGVMGGYMQPQGHVQVVMNTVDFALNPQEALDAPRWQWMRDDRVTVETRFDPHLAEALQRKGHRISVDLNTPSFGRGQMIVRLDNGVLVGGTESRTDSNIACC